MKKGIEQEFERRSEQGSENSAVFRMFHNNLNWRFTQGQINYWQKRNLEKFIIELTQKYDEKAIHKKKLPKNKSEAILHVERIIRERNR